MRCSLCLRLDKIYRNNQVVNVIICETCEENCVIKTVFKWCDCSGNLKMQDYSAAEKVQIIKWFYSGSSDREIVKLFADAFENHAPPQLSTIQCIVKHFEKHGCVSSKGEHKKSRLSTTKKQKQPKRNRKTYPESFESTSSAHDELYTNENAHKCKLCSKSFKSTSSLCLHEKSHNRAHYRCEICKELFRYRKKLTQHRKWHADRFQEQFGSKYKRFGFGSYGVTKNHRNVNAADFAHVGVKAEPTEICGLSQSLKTELKNEPTCLDDAFSATKHEEIIVKSEFIEVNREF